MSRENVDPGLPKEGNEKENNCYRNVCTDCTLLRCDSGSYRATCYQCTPNTQSTSLSRIMEEENSANLAKLCQIKCPPSKYSPKGDLALMCEPRCMTSSCLSKYEKLLCELQGESLRFTTKAKSLTSPLGRCQSVSSSCPSSPALRCAFRNSCRETRDKSPECRPVCRPSPDCSPRCLPELACRPQPSPRQPNSLTCCYTPPQCSPQCSPQCPPQCIPQCPPQCIPQCPPQCPPQCLPQYQPQCLPQYAPQCPPNFQPLCAPQCSPQYLYPPQCSPQCPPTCPPQCPPTWPPQCQTTCAPTCPPQCLPDCPPQCLPTCPPQCLPTCPPQCKPTCPPQCPPQYPPQCPPQCLPNCPPQCLPTCPPQCQPTCCPSNLPCTPSYDYDPDMKCLRPRGYEELYSGQATWEAFGVRINWTDPSAPTSWTVWKDHSLLLKLCVEVKPSACLDPGQITANCWTNMKTECNPCGSWQDIVMLYQSNSSSVGDLGIRRFVYSVSVTPTDDCTYRLSFNVNFKNVVIWAKNTQENCL